jgi:hypothetical protein
MIQLQMFLVLEVKTVDASCQKARKKGTEGENTHVS